jgi:tryptophanyl-tRNA synthetase
MRKAVTDSRGDVSYDRDNRPGVTNLIDIYSNMTGKSEAETVAEFAGCNTLQFKEGVAVAVSEHLAPIQAEYRHLVANPEYVTQVLDEGAIRATAMAEKTMIEVRRAVGFTI